VITLAGFMKARLDEDEHAALDAAVHDGHPDFDERWRP
jgi:hypothetical protein